ncbi:MAG: SPOR domain-containing protein [Thermodesulfobacteriota bacterium]
MRALLLLLVLLAAAPAVTAQGQGADPAEVILQAEDLLAGGDLVGAARHYRQALAAGIVDADIHRNLALVLYDLRLPGEALAAMDEAVRLAPGDSLLLMEQGVLALARERFPEAHRALAASLAGNPGRGEAYFYLGWLYLAEKKPVFAWYAARAAEKLGFDGRLLVDRLQAEGGGEPSHYPWQLFPDRLTIRSHRVASPEIGEALLPRFREGVLFEYLTGAETGLAEDPGEDIGTFAATEVEPAILAALAGSEPFSPPVLAAVGDRFFVVQRIFPFREEEWEAAARGADGAAAAVHAGTEPVAATLPVAEVDELIRHEIDPARHRVYVGSFPSEESALGRVRELRGRGFPAFCLVRPKGSGFAYYAVGGQYPSRDAAVHAVQRLRELGYDVFISNPKK